MSEGSHPETWHRLFLREEKQEIAREDLGLGTAATEDAAAFADDTHTHVPGDITGLDDYLSSAVGSLLVEGSGISLTQDSVTGAITIDAAGGGALDVLDEGGTIGGAFTSLDFVGTGVSVTDAGGGVAEVSIPGGSAPAYRGALVYNSAGQAITGSTNTVLSWDTASYDTEGCWSAGSPTRLTVPTGVTKVRLSGSVKATSAGNTFLEIRKNNTGTASGTPYPGMGNIGQSTSFNADVQICTAVIAVTAGDWFDMKVFKGTGGTATAQLSWFSMEIIE